MAGWRPAEVWLIVRVGLATAIGNRMTRDGGEPPRVGDEMPTS